MRTELREALREIAMFLLLYGAEDGEVAVRAFLGNDDPDSFDVERFPIWEDLRRAYERVFTPNPGDFPAGRDVVGIRDLLGMMPNRFNERPGVPVFATGDGVILRLADAYNVRIAISEYFIDGTAHLTSVKELSLIANMTEGAIRNEITKGKLSARNVRGQVRFEPIEVIRWLTGRRSYKPILLDQGLQKEGRRGDLEGQRN